MKKYLILIGFLVLTTFATAIFTGCAKNETVLKDESSQQQLDKQQSLGQQADSEQSAKEQASSASLAQEQSAREESAATDATAIRDINYDYDQSNIRPDAREILKANADIFIKKSSAKITVEGYCDERGTAEYNMALGERRAQEAKKYLANLGLKSSQIKTVSFGEERPLDPGNNEDAWAKNRRAHFIIKEK